ncbi:hypothetical protein M0805_006761 [Coniferiporia weirii]|nr:hypothetical protein M0805_006761 [Coniferiporia weirii]
MVSADNLHFDVLRQIFAHISGGDLISVALVSKAFLIGVMPRLYRTITFSQSQAKKYPKTVSPFALLLVRPYLAVHVRTCDISTLPLYKGQPNQEFLTDCVKALEICPNLTRFRLAPNVLPSFLSLLSEKEKLRDIHVNASVTTDQAEILSSLKGLRNIRLDHGSWCLMNLFPNWTSALSPTLTHLTFTWTSDLNEVILERALMNLPGLVGLHIRNCMKTNHTTVFRLICHTPLLESLSVTIWENPTTSSASFAELEVDIPDILVAEILDAHADTLTSLKFTKCGLSNSSLRQICRRCKNLEKLAIHVPMKEISSFASALSESVSLHILIDEPGTRVTHSPRATLRHGDVKAFMIASPKLRTVFSDSREWRGSGNSDNLQITLGRFKNSAFPSVMTFP